MKKLYLFCIGLLLMAFASQAQVKIYEFDSEAISEATIDKVIKEARKNGTQEWEIKIMETNLNERLVKYRESKANGKTRTASTQKIVPNEVMQACTNIDFEQGNYNGWTLTSGDINFVNLPCNTCATVAAGIANITSAGSSYSNIWTNGIDNCSGQPVVAPGGGNFSLCLNDKSAGGKIMEMQQTFQVSSTNNIFTFQYLAVLQSGGHPVNQQPYFLVQVLDQNNAVIPCTYYYAAAAGSINGWTAGTGCGSGVNYKGWVTITIDLSAYNNQNVTIQYIVSDCNQGGHWGYVYIDGQCGQINYTNNAGICNGQSAQLCGPPGYATYTWNGPQTGTTQCLTTGLPGTYTLSTTSSLGCPSPTLTYTVTQSPSPTANFSIATQPCSLTANFTDISTGNGGTISNWSWNFGDSQTATSTTAGNVQTHTYGSAGTYNVVMTCTTSAGCVSTFSVPVTVSASLGVTSNTTAVSCNGGSNGSVSVSPSGGSGNYTYTWTPSGSGSSSSNLPAGNYTIAISDGAGCNTTTVITLGQPTAVSATGTFTASTCGASNGAASVSASGGTGAYTYTWAPSGGNGSTASGLPAGSYTCNISDANGCLFSAPVTVANTSGPSVSVASTTSITCNGGTNGAASVNGSGGTGTLTYSWSPVGGSSSTASGLSAGVYTCLVTDANNCTTSTVVTISEPAAIVPTSTVTPTACGLTNGSATVSVTGGVGSYSYSWTPTGGTANNASNLGAGGYTCTVTDGNGCTNPVAIFVTTSTGPNVSIASSNSITCNGGNDGAAAVNASGGGGSYTYTWSPSGGSNASASGLTAGSYTCVVSDQNGCITTTVVTLAQPSPINGVITSTNVSCNGGTNGAATISGSGGTGALTYSWTPVGISGATASNLAMGTYTCTITDASGCTATSTVAIAQPPALTVTVGSSSVTCNGGTNGTATVTVSGGTNPYFYAWSPSGGTNSTAVGLAAGTYTCAVLDSKGCVSGTVTTIIEPLAVAANVSTTDVVCYGQNNGSATVTVTNGTGSISYTWSPTGGGSATASSLSPGTYTCTATDANGCKASTVAFINQPAVITTSTTTTPVKCSGGSDGSAVVNASGGTSPYTISWNTNPVQTGTVATGMSEGAYTVTVTDSKGCIKKKSVVIVAPQPKDSLEATGSMCSTDANILLTAPAGGVSPNLISGPYQWYASNSALPGETNTTYNADASQVDQSIYAVTWFYQGCRYVTTDIIKTVYQDLASLPQSNIFTPNADKINDEFFPFSFANAPVAVGFQFSSLVENYELWVYDRWGKLMFNTSDASKLWDGKAEGGKDCPDGTYYWIVKYKTHCNGAKGEQEAKGFVQLLR